MTALHGGARDTSQLEVTPDVILHILESEYEDTGICEWNGEMPSSNILSCCLKS